MGGLEGLTGGGLGGLPFREVPLRPKFQGQVQVVPGTTGYGYSYQLVPGPQTLTTMITRCSWEDGRQTTVDMHRGNLVPPLLRLVSRD